MTAPDPTEPRLTGRIAGDVTLDWLRDLIANHSTPLNNGAHRVIYTQRQLATLSRRSESTIQARLKRLDAAGLVVCTRPLVVRDPDLDPTTVATSTVIQFPSQPGRSGSHEDPAPPTTPDGWRARLLEANRALADAAAAPTAPTDQILAIQASVLAALTPIGDVPTSEGHHPSRGSAVADHRGTAISATDKEGREETSSLTSCHDTPSPSLPKAPHETAPRNRDPDQEPRILDLLAPLIATADRLNLTPISNREPLIDVLSAYTDKQISRAVSHVDRLARDGVVRSPFGWLITKAKANDKDLFPPPEPDTGPTSDAEQDPPWRHNDPLPSAEHARPFIDEIRGQLGGR